MKLGCEYERKCSGADGESFGTMGYSKWSNIE